MTDQNGGASSPVHDLIRQRDQLRGWLDKLGTVASGASSKVAERVRQDYQDRLRRVTEDLSLHRDEIVRDLETRRAELGGAEQRRSLAVDVLEEVRLRHMIGELPDAEWATQQEELQGHVDAASREVEHAQSEVERLTQLSHEVEGSEAPVAEAPAEEPEAEPEAEAEPEPVAEAPAEPEAAAEPEAEAAEPAEEAEDEDVTKWLDQLAAATGEGDQPEAASDEDDDEEEAEGEGDGGDLPWLEEATQPEGWTPDKDSDGLEFLAGLDKPAAPEPEKAESLEADDLAFLEELDRAIGSSPTSGGGSRAPTPPPAQPAGGTPAPASSGGSRAEPLLCKECGAINEPHSWYCEICGSEL